ncbi:hypothetical protein LCGC14_2338720, partial [marine sediment metagenome]
KSLNDSYRRDFAADLIELCDQIVPKKSENSDQAKGYYHL